MRYLKGTVSISDKDDLPILRTVHRAGHLTNRQLFEYLHPSPWLASRWDSFRWRVRRLAEHGLIDRQHMIGLGDVLCLGENGEILLQGREPIIVERNSRSRTANGRSQQWHDCDLFGIQLALRRAGVVQFWEYETEVRAKNDFSTLRYVKDYDAVVTFRDGANEATVALEYERTAKSSREYGRICDEINREKCVGMFLYLTPSLQLHNFLLHALRKTYRPLCIGIASEFCGDPQGAVLIEVRTGTGRRFKQFFDGSL